MSKNAMYRKPSQLFSLLTEHILEPGAALHVAHCSQPSFALETADAYHKFRKQLSTGALPRPPWTINLFVSTLVEGAVVLGAIGSRLEMRLLDGSLGANGTLDSTVIIPTVRILVAGPSRDSLSSMLVQKGCQEVIVREVTKPRDGIREILFTEREVRLRVDNPETSAKSEMKVLKAWFRNGPDVFTFFCWPGGRLVTGFRAQVINGAVFDEARKQILGGDDPEQYL